MTRPSNNRMSLDALVSELEGLLDLGATREAQKVIGRILVRSDVTVDAFWAAIRGIGMGPRPRRWREKVENAYANLPKTEQRIARVTMLSYFHMINESRAALRFCSLRELRTAGDILFAMDVFLDQDKLKEAGRLAKRAEKYLAGCDDAFDLSCLIEAVASYHARMRRWQRASDLWSRAPRDQPLSSNASTGISEVFMAGALDAIQNELTTVAELKRRGRNAEMMLSLPGTEEGLFSDTEKRLLRTKRGLERLLPERRRKALGLADNSRR
jgi:hypothetical protein